MRWVFWRYRARGFWFMIWRALIRFIKSSSSLDWAQRFWACRSFIPVSNLTRNKGVLMLRLWILIGLICMSTAVWAEDLTLSGIIKGKRLAAIVNDRIVAVGDS